MNKKNLWLLIGIPVCLILVVSFIISGNTISNPIKNSKKLNPEWYKPELPRENIMDNAVIIGNCWVCHAMWASVPQISEFPVQFVHPEVKLNHGKNNRCFNCHLESDRNHYVANDGISRINYFNVELLCARCHGLVYKRWKAGMHGSRRGKWAPKNRFDTINFKCTYCHDPHNPKYKFTKFDPAPVWDKKFIRLKPFDKFEHSPYSKAFPEPNLTKGNRYEK